MAQRGLAPVHAQRVLFAHHLHGVGLHLVAAASKAPEAMPMRQKFSGVIGVAQARMAFTAP